MPIGVNKNTAYGPPLVTDKYRPLKDPQIVQTDSEIYSGLLLHRHQLLKRLGLWPQPLRLIVRNWDAITAGEANHNPPLLVVSSGRSAWIRKGIDVADGQLATLTKQPPVTTFAGPYDLRALRADDFTVEQSPPIYAPVRLGPAANRNVYVVVHALEYDAYLEALDGTHVNVVGWEFQTQRRTKRGRPIITGFGASRFAAIEFCKYLRGRAAGNGPAPWDLAWLFDDNVILLSPFQGFTEIEDVLSAAQPEHVAAGFHGGTKLIPFKDTKAEARAATTYNGDAPAQPASQEHNAKGLIQQAALWNIKYLTEKELSFPKIYVTSGEDVSFGIYFDLKSHPYQFYNAINVTKENATSDDSAGAKKLAAARQLFTRWLADSEEISPIRNQPKPPFPLVVKPQYREVDGDLKILGRFVVNNVLPNASEPIRAKKDDPGVQDTARSQAVEQLTTGAMKAEFVSVPALTATFTTAERDAPVIFEWERG